MPLLFSRLRLRDVEFPNRIGVSPMCQYSAVDGLANDWHLVNLGSFAVGGAGLVIAEATAVHANGRISPQDLGLWHDGQVEPLARIARFVASQGAVPGIQLAHAGRKASTRRPWDGGGQVPVADGGWLDVVGPSAIPFSDTYPRPQALGADGIGAVVSGFASAARRAHAAGFRVIEIHGAHGYLLHSFLSPLSNHRDDEYGGAFAHRIRLLLEVTRAVRGAVPDGMPVLVRVSATDWAEGGWDIEECVDLARRLRTEGVDLIDCSSGGNVVHQRIPVAPGYQVPFASRIRREADIPTAAVGLITSPTQAEQVLADDAADMVFLARELLRNPRWAQAAAQVLGHTLPWPPQYLRAAPAGTPPLNAEPLPRRA